MAIHLEHFDTKLSQKLEISEKVENSLAEYLFPETEFAIGAVYKDSAKPEDLKEYEGRTLQFSSGERMYFASDEVRDLVYPNKSDGAAYGSLVFTPCKSFSEQSVRVLIVDDATGENGGMMPPEDAKKLVGDCYGRISRDLAQELTGKQNTPFQFRMGIKPQAENDVYRIAKGTLAPANLESLSEPFIRSGKTESGSLITKTGYDLVMATSSFKGRKGADAIKPGEYYLTVGIGVKSQAEYGEHSLGTQILVNYPKGVEADILPELKEQAKRLAAIQSDPRAIAQYYVEKYEKRQALAFSNQGIGEPLPADFQSWGELSSLIDEAFGDTLTSEENFGDLEDDEASTPTQRDKLLYRLLKADLEGHGQLLEHPKITDELNKFVRKEWVDIATGRGIKFQSGLAQPTQDLAKDEICVPHFPEGKEVIVTRSPLVNSNGVIVLTNKHLKEFKHEQGTVHIHPETAAAHLQADFDGDRLAFQLADKYQTLAAEVKEHNAPENRYPDIVKRDKVPYTADTFAEIALSARENKIGIIANQIQKAVALQWETQLVPQEEKANYLKNISYSYKRLLQDDANPKKDLHLPNHFRERIQNISDLPKELTPQQIDEKLTALKEILFDVVSELGNELQVAVDGPKSAARPDEDVLQYCSAISNYRDMGWLKDKKSPDVYHHRPMDSTNYSPIDLMVRQTNQLHEVSKLEARPTHQFRQLFNQTYSAEQEAGAKTIKDTYNQYVRKAKNLEEKALTEPGPVLTATSVRTGKQIEITNLLKFDHPDVWRAKELNIRLVDNDKPTDKMPHSLIAVAMVDGVQDENGLPVWKHLGTVSENSVKEHSLQAGIILSSAQVELKAGIGKHQVKAIFKEANQYLQEVNAQTPEDQKGSMASALWQVCHTKNKNQEFNNSKKASVAFNTYPDQVVAQLSTLQFTELSVVGTHQPTNEHLGRNWGGEKVPIEIVLETRADHPNYGKRVIAVEGKQLGPLQQDSPALPIGTHAEAYIVSPPSASVTATTAKGNTLKITQLQNHGWSERTWKEEQAIITIGFKDNPNPHKPSIPVILVEGKVLGVLDKESADKLCQHGILKSNVAIQASLQSAPTTTAYLKVDASTLTYPESWTREKDKDVLAPEGTTQALDPAPARNPLADLQPLNPSVAQHMQKDIAMADVASQFIGFSSAPPETPSSTRNYGAAWGDLANTGVYSSTDTIMASGSGPWRGVTQQQIESTFEKHYVPLLDQAVAAKSSFVVGSAAGTDLLVQKYLEEKGYKLEPDKAGYTRCSPEYTQAVSQAQSPSSLTTPTQTPQVEQSAIPPRPDWERKIITAALRSLETNPANVSTETKVASLGKRYAVVYTTKDETLQILDVSGDRGTLYKAQKGQLAEVIKFSEQEKAAFASIGSNHVTNVPKPLNIERC